MVGLMGSISEMVLVYRPTVSPLTLLSVSMSLNKSDELMLRCSCTVTHIMKKEKRSYHISKKATVPLLFICCEHCSGRSVSSVHPPLRICWLDPSCWAMCWWISASLRCKISHTCWNPFPPNVWRRVVYTEGWRPVGVEEANTERGRWVGFSKTGQGPTSGTQSLISQAL